MEKISTKNKTIKFISALLIISIILPSVLFSSPKKVSAGGVLVYDAINSAANWLTEVFSGTTSASTAVNTATTLKKWAVDLGKELLKVAAKRLLAQMTQATINWINSDFHGSPLFLENPDSFFRDIMKSELKNIVNTFGFDAVTYPFGKQFALNAINSYKRQLEDNAGYTLRNVMSSAEQIRFRNDFNYGGWNGFLINTQYPQNNYIGFTLLASDTLGGKIQGISQNTAQRTQSLLQQGMGFLGPQKCESNPDYDNSTNPWQKGSFQYNEFTFPDCGGVCTQEQINDANNEYQVNKAKAKAKWEKENICPDGLVGTTPGSAVANQLFTSLETPFLSTALDGALGNSLAAIFDALINNLMGKGLNALSSSINPEPEEDNWSYNDITLNNNDIINNNTDIEPLNIPENVSVYVEQETSTYIYGGVKNYSIQPQSNESKAIAIATIDVSSSYGPKLKIKAGKTLGTTLITVKDSSIPAQTVTVTVTVNAVGDLVVIPASITTTPNANNQIIANISGGTEPYSMQNSSNQETAVAILSGTNLIVTGIKSGETFVKISDSSVDAQGFPNPKTVIVKIVVNPEILTITPPTITVDVGQTSKLAISNGTPFYTVTSPGNTNVATTEVLIDTPTSLTVTGITGGISFVSIQDSSNPAKTADVKIMVNPEALIVTPPPASINIGDVASLTISKGTPPYTFTNQNQNVANVKIVPIAYANADLIITGLKIGTTSVIVQDSSTPAQVITINIKVVNDLYGGN